jgi:O-methyltransferase
MRTLNAIEEAIKFTKSSPERYVAMLGSLNMVNANNIEGDIVECGVGHGGNIILARTICPTKICWLYDTFNGMTRPDTLLDIKLSGKQKRAIDRYEAKAVNGHKWDAVSLQDVKKNFESFGLLNDNLMRFVKGDVVDTLQESHNVPDKISLLRLDTDWYHSTKIELDILYPRLESKGIMIIDDYGHWAGCKKAVDDYFAVMPEGSYQISQIDYTAILVMKC